MQRLQVKQYGAIVALSEQELLLINNALNEVCHGIDVRGFETRLGVTRAFAEDLLGEIGTLLGEVPPPSTPTG